MKNSKLESAQTTMIGICQRDKVANKKVLVIQLCLTLCDSTDCSLPGSTVNRIFRSGKCKASAEKKRVSWAVRQKENLLEGNERVMALKRTSVLPF